MNSKLEWDRLTTSQAAEIVGCSDMTITNARIAGQFPSSFKAGRNWSYTLEEVERFSEYFNRTVDIVAEEEIE